LIFASTNCTNNNGSPNAIGINKNLELLDSVKSEVNLLQYGFDSINYSINYDFHSAIILFRFDSPKLSFRDTYRYNWDTIYNGLGKGIKVDSSYCNFIIIDDYYLFTFNDFDRYIILIMQIDETNKKHGLKHIGQSIRKPYEIRKNNIYSFSDGENETLEFVLK